MRSLDILVYRFMFVFVFYFGSFFFTISLFVDSIEYDVNIKDSILYEKGWFDFIKDVKLRGSMVKFGF